VDALASGGITNIQSLRQAIDHLPTSLDNQYKLTLERIQGQTTQEQELAYKAILLLTYSCWILGVAELLEALTVDIETGSVNQERRTTEETLIDVCMGLVTVERTSKTVQLIRTSLHLLLPFHA
jgi:ankyrin repeat domain-containing protein 50